ncbi:Hypothetical protein BQ3484_13 [Cedratvirus A11]|uniref:Transmembrane protein n=1 Tax=Cedratvirus A11 TaxID=1903266 RepID=A0A1M7XTS4_9VIRU|nr:Hypothetical protein BQ3484_13 [Cedratvirus A11]SHO33081.1 Hypothetical protein BQ3484_13 [Cedratvirus A11]
MSDLESVFSSSEREVRSPPERMSPSSDLQASHSSSEREVRSLPERMSPSSDPLIERKHFYILASLYAISVLSVFLVYKVASNLPFWEEVMVALFLGLPLASLGLFLLLLVREMYLVCVIFLRLIKRITEENNVIIN